MREKLKNNSKIKLISLLSSLVLWMYVMAVVDPEETKVIEDVPVTITNMNELNDKDLIIYPEIELTTSISITGKLSSLQKVKKDDINIHGQINNPIEGKNQIRLNATMPQRLTYEFKNQVMIINLEKVVEEEKDIKIKVEGISKGNVDRIELQDQKDSVQVVGPRSLVDNVNHIMANLNTENRVDDFETILSLEPVDSKGNKVEGVDLEMNSVNAKVTLLQDKTVPIKVKFSEGNDLSTNLKNYKLSQNTVIIKGKKDVINQIESISTETIDVSNIKGITSKEVGLDIPEGVKCETKSITINIDATSKVSDEFTYTSQEIQIRNADENFDISKLNIPKNIKVQIEYNDSIGTVSKEDVTLYIDLSQGLNPDNSYEIKYESKYSLDKLNITSDGIVE